MDMNIYSVEMLARERLVEARARVARERFGGSELRSFFAKHVDRKHVVRLLD